MRIFISAGEPSGDLHGANLIRAIQAERPNTQFVGYGGPLMAEAGCDPATIQTPADWSSADMSAARPTRLSCAPSSTTTPSSSTPEAAHVITRAART